METRKRIAEVIRANAEEYQKTSPFDKSLREMCAICATALATAFVRAGYFAQAYYGRFHPKGRMYLNGHTHCWVVVRHHKDGGVSDETWDITATQFGDFPRVFLVTDEHSPYHEAVGILPGLEDLSFWAKWPPHQLPVLEVVERLAAAAPACVG